MLIRAENVIHKYGRQQVLQDISLEIAPGEIVGLLGKSGSGKSTLGRIMTGLMRPSSGRITYKSQEIHFPFKGETRQHIQILFQHPEVVFNPRMTLMQSLQEVYKLYRLPFTEEGMYQMLEAFSIHPEYLKRYPAQLSGGELQRIALARILLIQPEFIVLDEPTSMLDVISQAHIMKMLMEIREKQKIAYLFITHDECLCEYVSDRIMRISEGKLQ